MHGWSFTVFCTMAVLVALILGMVSVPADAGWVTKTISDNSTNALGGKISGDFVLFTGRVEGPDDSQNRIYLYRISTGEKKTVGLPSVNMTITGPEISGEYATWFETPRVDFGPGTTGIAQNRVFLCSIRNGSAGIIDDTGNAWWPRIDRGKILWQNDVSEGLDTRIVLYDIDTGERKEVCTLPIVNPAAVLFNGDRIAYLGRNGLFLYSLTDNINTEVFRNNAGNVSNTGVSDYAMKGDYLVYTTRRITFEGQDKGSFKELFLYVISTGKTERIDPVSGTLLGSSQPPAGTERSPDISSPFTDGKRIGWVYTENSPRSSIVLCDPQTGAVEKISLDGIACDVSIDGDRIIWVESHFPSFHGDLVLAQEIPDSGEDMRAAAPGFSSCIGILALMGALMLLCRKK